MANRTFVVRCMTSFDIEGVMKIIDPGGGRFDVRRQPGNAIDYLRDRLEHACQVGSWVIVVVAVLTEVLRLDEDVVLLSDHVIAVGGLHRLLVEGTHVAGTYSLMEDELINDPQLSEAVFDALYERIRVIALTQEDWCDQLENGANLFLL